ncbi:VOC family protein [Nocardioides perillae]|uniref:Catechol 2,3-dioxygenase-like lactoylglutathione lyase family enzyme n=1 Tax=Nocardioides perillae TaxID=1119534 RepID=A0A7Y9UL76_9ACTN|nr:VOC family protein [Nocardioides perillae]NYG54086.1 catechol 2,3-dioxygenase-like lactoylglutathione lyase family enzyme [Nocardioides perillae]
MVDTHSPTFRLRATVVGTPDPRGLAEFWGELLEWEVRESEPDWVRIGPPDSEDPGLSFQLETDHVPPVWPAGPGQQQMQLHLDVLVDDLEAAVGRAQALGARVAEHQPEPDVLRVLLDPDGHPFCLFLPGA